MLCSNFPNAACEFSRKSSALTPLFVHVHAEHRTVRGKIEVNVPIACLNRAFLCADGD